MLTKIRQARIERAAGKFAIVASQYNSQYVDAMLQAAEQVLAKAKVKPNVVRVPGAFEIPVVADAIASKEAYHVVICLGVILRGETTHAQFIGEAVTRALLDIQLAYQVPVIHEVLLLENEEQAKVRCLGTDHNRGAEAAHTALEMVRVMKRVRREF